MRDNYNCRLLCKPKGIGKPSYRWITGNFGDDLGMIVRTNDAGHGGGLFHEGQNLVRITKTRLTTEYEPGLASHDLAAAYEKFAPRDGAYEHERTWHDDNGHSHVRATFTGPSVTVPLVDGRLTLGTWQQIVLLDFDTRERQREIIVQVVGE